MTPNLLPLALPIRSLNGGLFISRGDPIVHRHRVIDSHELIFVRRGELGMYEEDRRFLMQAGDSLLLWSGRRHGGTRPFSRDLSFYWVHFQSVGLPRRPRRGGVLRLPQQRRVSRPERLTELMQWFLHDQQTGRLTDATGALLMMLMLAEVADTGRGDEPDPGGEVALAGRADRIIRTRYHEPLSTSRLAAELGCNPDYLGRIFHHVHGRTVTQMIHHCRIRRARSLLVESGQTIEEIARACGFRDAGYFRRCFGQVEGISPRAYRRLHALAHVNAD